MSGIVPSLGRIVWSYARRYQAEQINKRRAFGVITALELELFDLPPGRAGAAFFPIERAAEVLHTWRELTAKVDDRTTNIGRLLRVPPGDPRALPRKQFVMVEAIHIGDQRSGEEVVKGIRDLRPAAQIEHVRPDPDRGADPPAHGPAGARAGQG